MGDLGSCFMWRSAGLKGYSISKLTSLEFVLLCPAELVVAGGGALVCGVLEGVLCNITCYHGNRGSKGNQLPKSHALILTCTCSYVHTWNAERTADELHHHDTFLLTSQSVTADIHRYIV